MTIIISADYFGAAIQSAREHNHISALQMGKLFGVDIGMLHRYEQGKDLIPRNVLRRVFTLAVLMNAMSENE